MTPELQHALAEFLTQLKATGDAQLPVIAEQWLRWAAVDAAGGLLLGLAMLIAVVYTTRKAYVVGGDFWGVVAVIVGLFGGIFGSILTVSNIGTLVQLTVAPKVYLLQQFARLGL